jgi:hypothetical protein
MHNEKPNVEKKDKKKIVLISLAVTLAVTISIYILTLFVPIVPKITAFLNDDAITTENAKAEIEKQYRVKINFPNDWRIEDCSPSDKRYSYGIRYVCKWVSPPHPESGFLFLPLKDRSTVGI